MQEEIKFFKIMKPTLDIQELFIVQKKKLMVVKIVKLS